MGLTYSVTGLSSQPARQALSYCGTNHVQSPPGSALQHTRTCPPLEQAGRAMRHLPNDVLSMCHWSELLQSLGGLVHTVLQIGEVHPTLKRLISIISIHTQGIPTVAPTQVMARISWV